MMCGVQTVADDGFKSLDLKPNQVVSHKDRQMAKDPMMSSKPFKPTPERRRKTVFPHYLTTGMNCTTH